MPRRPTLPLYEEIAGEVSQHKVKRGSTFRDPWPLAHMNAKNNDQATNVQLFDGHAKRLARTGTQWLCCGLMSLISLVCSLRSVKAFSFAQSSQSTADS